MLPAIPLTLPGIENIRLTAEDRGKAAMYGAQAARRQHEEQSANLDDFLRSLELEVAIEPATAFSLPRIAQLTQKTNQMNMTTRRYTESQVLALMRQPEWVVLSVAARDRFGEQGIVGVILLRFDQDECVIDTLLLSCRVIGRGIEAAMIAHIADLVRGRGLAVLVGEFIPTPRNRPAAAVYGKAGFVRLDERRLAVNVREVPLPYPEHIRVATAGSLAR
jgi:FkbH-like protein